MENVVVAVELYPFPIPHLQIVVVGVAVVVVEVGQILLTSFPSWVGSCLEALPSCGL